MAEELFTVTHPLPWVYHLRDAMGVYMTLLVGDNRALLVDTGYGLFNPRPQIAAITPLPVTVVCTHAHHDHLLGSRWFGEALLSQAELPRCDAAAGAWQRERTLARARELRLPLSAEAAQDFLAAPSASFVALRETEISLGGTTVEVLPMPGHTDGSIGLWVPRQRLLLAGDNFNPVVWLFFAESLPLKTYVEQMQRALAIPFGYALCPHSDRLYTRNDVERYVAGIDQACLRRAKPVSIHPYENIPTYACTPAEGFTLVFDLRKSAL